MESDRRDPISLEDWHRFLTKTLPAYMLPGQVTTLAKMPINLSGKVDRKALAEMATKASRSSHDADRGGPPRGQVEQHIAEVWQQTLGARPVQRDDNYFALGGTSLLAIAISARLQALGYAVPAQTILVATTVASLANRIAWLTGEEQVAAPPAAQQDTATSGQEDFWIASKLGLGTIGSQITRVLAVRGTVPEPPRWQSAWTQLMARHAALRKAFFADSGGKVVWRTEPAEDLLPVVQFSVDQCASLNDAQERIAARSDTPFALTEPPLARAGLIQVADRGGESCWALSPLSFPYYQHRLRVRLRRSSPRSCSFSDP